MGKDIKQFYEGFTDYLARDRVTPNPRHLKLKGDLTNLLRGRKLSVLEVGCGIGILSEHIWKYTPDLVALDISDNNIKFAKETVRGVKFQQADFLEFNAGKTFDMICLFDVLEHFPRDQHQKVFEKIAAHSHTKTVILINIPDADYMDYVRVNNPEKLQVVDESIHFDYMLELLNNNGMRIQIYQRYGIDGPNQYRFYILDYREV